MTKHDSNGLHMVERDFPTQRRKDITQSIIIAFVLTGFSYLVGIWASWISTDNLGLLEPFAVWTSYACTWLCVKERRINYPLGIISSAAYAYLFYKFDLVASTVLNLYLVPTLVYGWFRWRPDADTRPVTRLPYRLYPLYLAVTGAVWLGARGAVALFDGTMAWADALILAGTVLAQFLLDNKRLETWAVWVFVNVFAIYTYATTGLSLVAFQYVFFLLNTGIGAWAWWKSMRKG